ncbi:hypothetical protein J6590_068967 [Homalodisca vitripennis]|nr:hypothetical protein J6590_068967 [Homalodisca vitripennis]
MLFITEYSYTCNYNDIETTNLNATLKATPAKDVIRVTSLQPEDTSSAGRLPECFRQI